MSYVKVKTKESKLLQNEYIRDLTTPPMQQRVEDCGHSHLHVHPTASPGPCSPDNQVKKKEKKNATSCFPDFSQHRKSRWSLGSTREETLISAIYT